MSNLLWFKGITWNTEMGRVGWVWVFLGILSLILIYISITLIREIRGK